MTATLTPSSICREYAQSCRVSAEEYRQHARAFINQGDVDTAAFCMHRVESNLAIAAEQDAMAEPYEKEGAN